jgi:hypothetical protein
MTLKSNANEALLPRKKLYAIKLRCVQINTLKIEKCEAFNASLQSFVAPSVDRVNINPSPDGWGRIWLQNFEQKEFKMAWSKKHFLF